MPGDNDWNDDNDRPDYPDVRPFLRTTKLARIRFWDVGTGNCNGLYDAAGRAFIYYDFGGNAGKGAPSYPTTTPAFDYDAETVFFISHWDEDHVYSIKKSEGAKESVWIGPRESISSRAQRKLLVLEALYVWSKTVAASRTYESTAGLQIDFHRLPGNPHGSEAVADVRNNTGISLAVTQSRPSPVAARLEAMKEEAKKLNATVPGVVGAAGVTGTDFFVNAFVTAVRGLSGAQSTNAVIAAAGPLVGAQRVPWAMATLVTVAARSSRVGNASAASVNQAVANAYATCGETHALVQAIRAEAGTAAAVNGASAADVAGAVRAKLLTLERPASIDTFVAMLDHALGNPTDTTGTAEQGAPGADTYVNLVIEAAHGAARNTANANNAAAVVDAALAALVPPATFVTRILLTGDGSYIAHNEAPSLAGFYEMPWDVLLAYHHGSYVDFVGASTTTLNQSPAPRPALPGQSAIIYSSGLNRYDERVHGHPHRDAIDKYEDAGWTIAHFTAAVEGNPARHDIDYTLP